MKKDTSRTYLLAAINYLFSEYGFEHQDILLNGFFYIAELLINNIPLFGPSEDSFIGSTDESDHCGLTYEVVYLIYLKFQKKKNFFFK